MWSSAGTILHNFLQLLCIVGVAGIVLEEGDVELRSNGSWHEDHNGRVYIRKNGQWGTICYSSTSRKGNNGRNIARVVCRMLGYSGGSVLNENGSWFYNRYGRGGSGTILVRDVICNGNESAIDQCSFPGWNVGTDQCSHDDDLAVYCLSTRQNETVSVILRNGQTPWRGRVHVLHNREWGTICQKGWDDNDANVICRMMGYRGGKSAYFGDGRGQIWSTNVDCFGTESSILQCGLDVWGCPKKRRQHKRCGGCNNRRNAGVICDTSIIESSDRRHCAEEEIYGQIRDSLMSNLRANDSLRSRESRQVQMDIFVKFHRKFVRKTEGMDKWLRQEIKLLARKFEWKFYSQLLEVTENECYISM